jgi:L-threonylcarbamoyladenylate synthase
MASIGSDISEAAELLRAGKPVAIPTETVYGLAANALDPIAVARIFEIKRRPFFDPLIVHTFSLEQAESYVKEFPLPLKKLATAFWPGPLTLLLPKKDLIPDLTTSGLDRVGLRVPDNALTLNLLRSLDFPLAAPSANPFGYISPTKAEHVQKQLGKDIDYILDGGDCKVGLESTIVGMEGSDICVYRLGGLSIEAIEEQVGKVKMFINVSSDPTAPGQLKSHYAPRKPLFLGTVEKRMEELAGKRIGLLVFGKIPAHLKIGKAISLSEGKDLKEAAAKLFGALRELDESDVDVIISDYLPERGLGLAINDRLKRAAHLEDHTG